MRIYRVNFNFQIVPIVDDSPWTILLSRFRADVLAAVLNIWSTSILKAWVRRMCVIRFQMMVDQLMSSSLNPSELSLSRIVARDLIANMILLEGLAATMRWIILYISRINSTFNIPFYNFRRIYFAKLASEKKRESQLRICELTINN